MLKFIWCSAMNEELLIVVNYFDENQEIYKKNITKLNNIFKNIVICNKNNIQIDINYPVFSGNNYDYLEKIYNYIKLLDNNILSIVFIDNIMEIDESDIVKCASDAINHKEAIILGSKDIQDINSKLLNNIYNALFNTNFKSVNPNIKAISNELFETILNNLKNDNNYLITAINENIPIKEENIKTIWRKDTKRVGKRPSKILPYLNNIFPYIIKSLIPYLISLLLFMLIFYLKSSTNDLEGIILANIISEGVGIIIHITLNYQSVYKYNLISRNILFILKKLFRITLSSFFIYILYNLLNINLLISKLLIDTILMIIIALLFNKLTKK